jgi:aryl-alcohol dehydrogenase-like predicted oxidoreductase
VPIEETVGAIADMVKALYVRHIGISEIGAEGLVEVSAGAAELRRLARHESGRVCQRVLMIANLLEGMEA